MIDTAIKKRKELLTLYQKESDVNPLLLIQLPDRKTKSEDTIKEKVIRILKDKYHIYLIYLLL